MLNLKIKTPTLMCLSSAKQLQFAVNKGTCTCAYKLISLVAHAVVVRLSYMTRVMESATVSLMRQILLFPLDV